MAKTASVLATCLAIALLAGIIVYFALDLGFFFQPTQLNETYTVDNAISITFNALNAIRIQNGLASVSLVNDPSASYRANDMIANQYFGHYDLNGYSPSYYYTALGGTYSMEENIAAYYNSGGLTFNSLMTFVNDSVYSMVYNDSSSNWGHRDSLMDPTNNAVAISFAYSGDHAFLVIHMIKEWVVWDSPPNITGGIFSCSGRWSLPGPTFESVDIEYSNLSQNANVKYDESLHLLTTGSNYSNGNAVAGVVPAPLSFNDVATIRPLTWDVNTGADHTHFAFSFNLTATNGPGIYTVVVWGSRPISTLDPFDTSRYSEEVPILEYSVFLNGS